MRVKAATPLSRHLPVRQAGASRRKGDRRRGQVDARARVISYAEAVCEATCECMRTDPRVIVVGEGVPDPKAVFGTTAGLLEEFGPERVLDMPLSENGMTGVLIGAALAGLRPVLVHQRIDFALLSMDQLVNNAAKWHFMFGGKASVPIVVRVLIGRGWGQGPQHSQSLQALFAHIPGLKVVMPATPQDAKGMLVSAIEDPNPVIFIEHRWLHGFRDHVPEGRFGAPLEGARIVRGGRHATVAVFSHMLIEALRVARVLSDFDIELEVIDMRAVSPLDDATVLKSVRRTGHLVVLDTGWKSGGISAELAARVAESGWKALKKAPLRIALPDHPVPTSFHLANVCYPEAEDIARAVLDLLGKRSPKVVSEISAKLRRKGRLDVPDFSFKGPF